VGALMAVALVFVLNRIRVVSLYDIAVYRHAWFLAVHSYLAPTLMIAVGGVPAYRQHVDNSAHSDLLSARC